ncbi:MAG TPA: NAD(P)-dependent oxidoreductase [Candidatus Dormibacteraeota bacterium]|nr:NAD(P)-dependent oxidoreductase [Candidatus Dormibacteraeota bacterium]
MAVATPLTQRRTVLVTGGASFLGRHLVPRLSDDGHSVRILDQAPRPSWVDTATVDYVPADVCDPAAVAQAMTGVDTVVHAAFASPAATPAVLHRVNVEGTRTVLSNAVRAGVRVVVVSSTIVERNLRRHPCLEGAPLSRLAAYRETRAAAEALADDGAAAGASVAVVRPKTFLGPGALGGFALLFELVRRGRGAVVLGDGSNRYQLLDVRDLASALSLLATSHAGGVFHLGCTEYGTVDEDLSGLLRHAGCGGTVHHVPGGVARVALRTLELASLSPAAEWHQLSACGRDSIVSIRRAATELGWQPERGNLDILRDSYDWYVERVRTGAELSTPHPIPASHRHLWRVVDVLLQRTAGPARR